MDNQIRGVATKALNCLITCFENKELFFDTEEDRKNVLNQLYAIREEANTGYIADEHIVRSIYTYAKHVINTYMALSIIPIQYRLLEESKGFKSGKDDITENVKSLSRKFTSEELWYALQMIDKKRARIVLETDSYVFDECYSALLHGEKELFCKTVKQGNMYTLSMRTVIEVFMVCFETVFELMCGEIDVEKLALISSSARMQQKLLYEIEHCDLEDIDEEMLLQVYDYTNRAGMELQRFFQIYVLLSKIPPSLRRELIERTNRGIYFEISDEEIEGENFDEFLEEASYLTPLLFKTALAEVHQYMATQQDENSVKTEDIAIQFRIFIEQNFSLRGDFKDKFERKYFTRMVDFIIGINSAKSLYAFMYLFLPTIQKPGPKSEANKECHLNDNMVKWLYTPQDIDEATERFVKHLEHLENKAIKGNDDSKPTRQRRFLSKRIKDGDSWVLEFAREVWDKQAYSLLEKLCMDAAGR